MTSRIVIIVVDAKLWILIKVETSISGLRIGEWLSDFINFVRRGEANSSSNTLLILFLRLSKSRQNK